MKKLYALTTFVAIAIAVNAQNIGIGTNNPTAQLHTTGTVRHAALGGPGIRPVFVDSIGNLLVNFPSLPPSSATNNTARAIPDINCTGVTSTNSLSGLPASVYSASIAVTINIAHPRVADLSIYLTAPGGSIINLLSPAAAAMGANLSNTVFIDAGVLLSSGAAPFTGQFKPFADATPSICGIAPTVASFAAIGAGTMNPNGTWTLKVIDNTAANTGTLNSWTISVASGLGVDGTWGLKGNSGTNAFNFIGTTDKAPLRFKVNNSTVGLLDTAGNLFFGGSGNGNIGNKGNSNIGIGGAILIYNTTGSSNTGIGPAALLINETGSSNIAIGSAALLFNLSGNLNTAIGTEALLHNSTGNSNTAVGERALNNSTDRSNLVAIGDSALFNNGFGANNPIQANFNTALGSKALFSTTLGYNNTATGAKALFLNTFGQSNTANGYDALYSNTTGSTNTAIGTNALDFNISGSDNTALGYSADVAVDNLNNTTVIGANAIVNQSNRVRIGNSSVTTIEGQVNWSYPSDGRFKTNVTETVIGLDFIKRLRPVVYNFQTKKYDEFLRRDMAKKEKSVSQDFSESESMRQSGFVAQEVEKAAKAAGYDFNGIIVPKNEKQTYSLSYSQFVVPLVKAAQEQQQQIELLIKENIEIKKQLLQLEEFRTAFNTLKQSKN